MLTILILSMALPAFAGILVFGPLRRGVRTVSTAASLVTLGLGTLAIVLAFPHTYVRVFGRMPWLKGLEPVGLFGVLIDPLASLALVVIGGLGFLAVLFSTAYLSDRNRERRLGEGQRLYYFWLLMLIAATTGVALSPNLLQLFIFWELTTLCSWALISHPQEEKTLRAGLKALVMTHIGGLFFLIALFILFVSTKSFSFTALAHLGPRMRDLVFLLLLVAAWAKAAQLPFHTWLPDAHAEAPSPVSAMLSGVIVKVAVYALARIITTSYVQGPALAVMTVGLVAAVMALLTMFMALALYFAQDDLKRLLAYSTIAHLSYVLLGIGMGMMGSELGFRGGLLHIINHAFAKGTLFLSAGAVVYMTGTRSIGQLGGLGRRLPLVGIAFVMGVLAITGVPPLGCFWSKFYLLTGALELKGVLGPIILGLVLLESVVSFAWMLRVTQKVFLGPPTEPVETMGSNRLPLPMMIVLGALIIMCVMAPVIGLALVAPIPYAP
jgi:hydrogenase-4 component D